jgi:transcriptional regulator with XRE-family HTH domain
MYHINGAKIRKIREDLGLTQGELAKSVGLSSEFISLLELGKRAPSLDSLSKIAGHLDKDISYFIMEKEDVFNRLFQAETWNKKTVRLLKKFKRYCLDYTELEELTGRHAHLAPLYTNISAERMAEQERRRIGLGCEPIRDIFSLLELNGLHVWRHTVPAESKIPGLFLFMDMRQSAFALVDSSLSYGHQALIAAHEYSHYLRDRHDSPVVDNPDVFIDEYIDLYPGRERFAQTFAMHFLMPPEKIREVVEKDIRLKKLNFEDIVYLTLYFGVSTLAILRMLRTLDFVPQARFKEYQKMTAKHQEEAFLNMYPGGIRMKIPSRQAVPSNRFISLVLEAHKKRKITAERATGLLRISKDKMIRDTLRSSS